MSMYPSLEDMKTVEMITSQFEAVQEYHQRDNQSNNASNHAYGLVAPSAPTAMTLTRAYPNISEFMGLELSEEVIRLNMPEYLQHASGHGDSGGTVATPMSMFPKPVNSMGVGVIAPISGSIATVKSMVSHGVRRVKIQKSSAKFGIRVRAINTGIFICLVQTGSDAARAGLRFGDQILQVDDEDMAGKTFSQAHSIFKKKPIGSVIDLALRDRPFERTITLVKDSMGTVGFEIKNGKIKNIVKDSSAARNGLLTNHNLLEINGRNVIGLKDKEILAILRDISGNGVTITVMPSFLYDHMIKEMATDLFGKMDHAEPEI